MHSLKKIIVHCKMLTIDYFQESFTELIVFWKIFAIVYYASDICNSLLCIRLLRKAHLKRQLLNA